MKNVTVSEQEIAEQEAADEQLANDMFASKPASKQLANLATRQTPSKFGVTETKTEGEDEKVSDEQKGADEEQPKVADGDDKESGNENNGTEEEGSEALMAESISSQLKNAYPDVDYENEEAVRSKIGSLIEDSENLAAERKANEKVYDLFEESPEMVQIARAMDSGASFLEALAGTVDIPKALEDMKEDEPEKYKEVMKAQARHEVQMEQRQKEQKKMKKDFEANQETSQENVESFRKQKEMDEKQADEFMNKIGDEFENIVRGKVTSDFLEVMWRGLQYEKAIEEAKEQGKVEGKNEKINAEKRKKTGDGLPTMPTGKPKKGKQKASDGKRAIVGVVSGSKSTFN